MVFQLERKGVMHFMMTMEHFWNGMLAVLLHRNLSFRKHFALFSVYWLFLLSDGVQGDDGVLCIVEPLRTPYLIPYKETPLACSGCLFPTFPPTNTTQKPGAINISSKVHVIESSSLTSDEGIVEVSLVSSKFLKTQVHNTFVLTSSSSSSHSSIPRSGRTTFIFSADAASRYNVYNFILLDDVDVVTDGLDFISYRLRSSSSDDPLSFAKSQFGFVSSFTRASSANRILFNLSKEAAGSSNCSVNVVAESSIATCTKIVQQDVDGCFHENMIGVHERDIHIIEVDGSQNKNDSILLLINGVTPPVGTKRATFDPTSGTGNPNALKRNLTLVLLSNQPTTWTLKVTNIQGIVTLLVGGGDQVENTSSPGQNISVSVKRIDLPKAFDGRYIRILTTIGTPISYTKTTSPKMIRMFVPFMHVVPEQATHPRDNIDVYDAEKASDLAKNSVSISCEDHGVVISLPMKIVKKVGGASLFLGDKSCVGTRNSSHLILTSRYFECDFSRQIDDDTELFTNFLHIEIEGRHASVITDDEDELEEGSAYGEEGPPRPAARKIPVLPVQCRRHYFTKPEINTRSEYVLQVYQEPDFRTPYVPQDYPLHVPLDGVVHAKLDFGGVNGEHLSGIRLLIEECLLSKSPKLLSNPVTLIRKSCSVQPYVYIDNERSINDAAFHFQISKEYSPLEKVYLHCQVGVCSNGVLPKPSLKKCVDPRSYCGKETLLSIFTNQAIGSLLKTVIVGPLVKERSNTVLPGTGVYSSSGNRNKQARRILGRDDQTQIVVMEGLSTEVVVGIAIAAFVIGVCLMTALWVIYIKTDPRRRQKRPETNVPRNCGYDLSGGHSGSSTPSSQAPMTA